MREILRAPGDNNFMLGHYTIVLFESFRLRQDNPVHPTWYMINCTILFPHSSVVKISPDGKHTAENMSKGVVVRSTETFLVEAEFPINSKTDRIIWSPDSTLICCWYELTFFPLFLFHFVSTIRLFSPGTKPPKLPEFSR